MDVQAIEILFEELGMSLPARATQTRKVVDDLSVLDVPLAQRPTDQQTADMIRGAVQRGEEVDPVALVRQSHQGDFNEEAARAVKIALDDALRLHDLSFRGGGLIPTVRTAIEDVYAKVRTLPNHTPTTPLEAVHADQKAQQAFVALEGLANRHSQLRRLHRLLIADDVSQPVALVLFADTRLMPAVWPSRVQPTEPAGPRELLPRLRWLATDAAQSWTPNAAEINARYLKALQSFNPVTAASAATKEK